jgi:hypothetical protein
MSGDPAHARQRPPAALASAWGALCCLPATHPWLWLVPLGAPGGFAAKIIEMGAYAPGAAAPLGVVLLDRLPGLLVALGAGALGHG